MEEVPTYLCNKCGKCFNHKIKLAVHKTYQHPKKASGPKKSKDLDRAELGVVPLRKFSSPDNVFSQIEFTQETNVQIVATKVVDQDSESLQQMPHIPLQSFMSLSENLSSPVAPKFDDYEMTQERPEIDTQEGSFQNEKDHISIGSSPSLHPPSSGKLSMNTKRKRDESVILTEPQNKLLKISTPSIFSEQCHDRVETLSQRSTKNKLQANSSERSYNCNYCVYSTKKSSHLRYHERTHTGEKPYKCQHCEYSSKTTSGLTNHERIHTGEKPYQCGMCDYAAKRGSSMLAHVKTHTGEKPYKCEHCSYSATQINALRGHERTHTGEKPYKCQICDHSSRTSSNLRAHERTHTGEKPFQCQYCDYSSTTSGYLRKHERRAHTKEQ